MLPWGRVWVAAVGLTLALFVCAEVGFRGLGFAPMVQDDARLWSLWRSRVDDAPEPVVLIGTSRVQLGIDPAVLAATLGRPVIDLAINGGSPLPVLTELAQDTTFRGTVISGFHPRAMFADAASWEQKSEAWVQSHRTAGFGDEWETRARVRLQEAFVTLLPDVMPTNVVATLARDRALPRPSYIRARADRFLSADYTLVARDRLERPVRFDDDIVLSDAAVAARLEALARDVAAIEARGGQVLFVRMVSTGATWAEEERVFPRARYYERAVRTIGAAEFLHFADDEVLAKFVCPDGGHLDGRDAAAYTTRLGELLGPRLR